MTGAVHCQGGQDVTRCGVRLTESVLSVPPHLAKHTTCKRCIRSLQAGWK